MTLAALETCKGLVLGLCRFAQRNVMLWDDNLLSYPGVEDLLLEMIRRGYAVNFNPDPTDGLPSLSDL